MTPLEEKLNNASWYDADAIRVLGYNDALSICQEAVDEAKIEENEFHQKCFPTSGQQMIFTYQIFEDRIKELKEKL